MRGGGLLAGGCVLCVALAAPAAIFASEEPPAAEPGSVTAEPVTEPPEQPQTAADIPAFDEEGAKEEDAGRKSGRGGANAHSSAEFAVAMRDIQFKPGTIRIAPGDTVEWRNEDEVRHDAIGKNSSFDTPVIGPGETSSHTFRSAGRYPYFCSLHQGMDGTVKVSSSSGGGGGSGGNGTGGASGGTSTEGTSSGASSFGSGSSSSLASTGEDVGWMVLAGGALVWLGAAAGVIAAAQQREQRRGE